MHIWVVFEMPLSERLFLALEQLPASRSVVDSIICRTAKGQKPRRHAHLLLRLPKPTSRRPSTIQGRLTLVVRALLTGNTGPSKLCRSYCTRPLLARRQQCQQRASELSDLLTHQFGCRYASRLTNMKSRRAIQALRDSSSIFGPRGYCAFQSANRWRATA